MITGQAVPGLLLVLLVGGLDGEGERLFTLLNKYGLFGLISTGVPGGMIRSLALLEEDSAEDDG